MQQWTRITPIPANENRAVAVSQAMKRVKRKTNRSTIPASGVATRCISASGSNWPISIDCATLRLNKAI